jgi:uncharacterized membrane protein
MKIDGHIAIWETLKYKFEHYWDAALFGKGAVLLDIHLAGWVQEVWGVTWKAALGATVGILVKWLWRTIRRKLTKPNNRQ